jgi:hypothetical protein
LSSPISCANFSRSKFLSIPLQSEIALWYASHYSPGGIEVGKTPEFVESDWRRLQPGTRRLIVYGILYALGHWTAAAVAGLAIMLAIVAREKQTANVKIIDLTSLGFFVLALIMLLTVGDQLFNRYHIILVWGVFAVVTWATILVGFPFTLQLARESARREVWREPLFRRVHLRLTTVWESSLRSTRL